VATREEILAWWDDPVANVFREKIGLYLKDFVGQMRTAVDRGDFNQASGWCARIAFCEEILEIKDEMLGDVDDER
jgi:hypothetical protein